MDLVWRRASLVAPKHTFAKAEARNSGSDSDGTTENTKSRTLAFLAEPKTSEGGSLYPPLDARIGSAQTHNAMTWEKSWDQIRPLGGGGQGDTLLVKSISGEPSRAVLKLLKPQKVREPKARGRMAMEVTNLKVLRNAGGKVPQVLDGNTEHFEDKNVPLFFVMEFIEGETLAKIVQDRTGLPVDVSVGIALDLCSTLRIAIKSGIVHRDIKPENIVVRCLEPPDVVMVDFGLSFNEDEADHNFTSADESLDNKFISLPERRGPGENKRDLRSDLTGICAILFYCLTGCSPRNLRDSRGRSPHQWPGYSLEGKVQNESQRNALDLFFSRGLSYEIDARFQTVEELSDRIEEIIRPRPTEVFEGLESVLSREVNALRKNDRATQLTEYYNNVQPIDQSLTLKLNELHGKVNKVGSYFNIMVTSPYFQRCYDKTPMGDLIARRIFGVGVQNHQHFFQIHYKVYSQGTECSVFREIFEGQLHEQAKATTEQPLLLLRYHGDSSPEAAVVVSDMERAVARAITLISQRIQAVKP